MVTERELSAGGVVVRDGACVVVVPTRRARGGIRVLTLPKGHVEPGEDVEATAVREVREEAGLEVRSLGRLGEVRYWYQRDGRRIAKLVVFFLCEYVAGELSDHDHEVEEARWMPLDEAERELSYRGERGMVALAKVHPACRS